MDPVTLTFYAVVCGLLGLVSPNLGRPAIRLGIGAVVGLIAAGALPTIRASLGL
ncbi:MULTISPECIES: hypothetical protein [Nioella]|jgi:hypothetical protein|uniref:hypothetical protein n=1 Tax=Nioella TaxID=1775424 RepID=UPI0013DF192B|nr:MULTISPECIES: hypothetical protein [Nioella]